MRLSPEKTAALAERNAKIMKLREMLLDQQPGLTRLYDLLAEGRHDAAVARAASTTAPKAGLVADAPSQLLSLPAQVASMEKPATTLGRGADRRFTKRLKR